MGGRERLSSFPQLQSKRIKEAKSCSPLLPSKLLKR
jgi:hypothetical protein